MIYDAIIIGAGPAGITAAVYTSRKGMKIKVLSNDIGGQVSKTSIVENYTGYQEITGLELAQKFNNHLQEFNFDFSQTSVKEIKSEKKILTVSTAKEKFQTQTLIIATGAKPRELDVEGEKIFRNKGVTYCATCDAPLFRNKEIVVIGGGNSALEAGIQLAKIAKKVYILNIASEFTGDRILAEKLYKDEKVEIFHNAKTTEISGEKSVNSVKFTQVDQIREISVEGVFVEIGFVPNTKLVKDLVQLNKKGEIKINHAGQTSEINIFAAGDCTDVPYKQIIIASGSGAVAGISAFNYLIKEK